MSLSASEWLVLDDAHKKRNKAEYEGDADINAALVAAVIRVGREVERRVAALGALPVS